MHASPCHHFILLETSTAYLLEIIQAVILSLCLMFVEHFLLSPAFFSTTSSSFTFFTFRHLMPPCFSFPPTPTSDCLLLLFYSFDSWDSPYYLLFLLSTPLFSFFLNTFSIIILSFYLSSSNFRFSRYDYQKVRNGPSPSYRSLIAALPLQVRTWSNWFQYSNRRKLYFNRFTSIKNFNTRNGMFCSAIVVYTWIQISKTFSWRNYVQFEISLKSYSVAYMWILL